MYDELTEADLQKLQEEMDHRILVLRPQLIKDVQEARAFGDLSENFEYKEAKRAKNRNEGRIRYLRQMIKTATVVKPAGTEGADLFDYVTYVDEDEDETTVQLVTTLRVDVEDSEILRISRESPLGAALMGKKAGDNAEVTVREGQSFSITVIKVEKGRENNDLPIAQY